MTPISSIISILVVIFPKDSTVIFFPCLSLSPCPSLERSFDKALYKAVWKCQLVVIVITCVLFGSTDREWELFHQGLQLSEYGVIGIICVITSLSLARTFPQACCSCGLSCIYWRLMVLERTWYILLKMPFCLQDDVVMGTLTVRENLQFSAALRLPSTMKNHEKNERINKVIQELGLAKVADSKVKWKQLMVSLPANRTSPVWVVSLLFRSFL